jgi:lantibiotic modifying enzyme
MTIKECCIHLDGSDKSGKSSIRRKIIQISNGKILVFVRTYISQILYSRIYKRSINERFFVEEMKRAQELGHKFFLITASTKSIEERFIKHNESDMNITDIDLHKAEINNIVLELESENIIITKIDTTAKSIDESAIEIIERCK